MKPNRREFVAATGLVTLHTAASKLRAIAPVNNGEPHIATNTYPWLTFSRRTKSEFHIHSNELLRDISQCGISGYEPIINEVSEFDGLSERLKKHNLQMRSLYVNSVLHEESKTDESINQVVEISKAASKLGAKIVVANPSPIRWGGPEDKTDSQLQVQAKALDRLGAALRRQGVTLAYHNHDAELRQGGREFHHMLTATDPQNVKLCLDAHWVFRGCGDSEVAVFDALQHYHSRIVELHLRQSVAGVWTEEFRMRGDIDYVRLFDFLAKKKISPHLVLEQAVEEESPHKLTVVQAHRQGRVNLEKAMS